MGNALGHHMFENDAEDVTVTELAMSELREARMIRHLVLEPKPTEPSISEIEMNLLAKSPLRAQPHDIADHQHPDHKLGIERRTSSVTVEIAYLLVQAFQI